MKRRLLPEQVHPDILNHAQECNQRFNSLELAPPISLETSVAMSELGSIQIELELMQSMDLRDVPPAAIAELKRRAARLESALR